ncbi:hypothetical protein ACFFHJ_21785 [Planotetraspora thailandica]|nr:hypothetical protein [Planotetraspora thailandica]
MTKTSRQRTSPGQVTAIDMVMNPEKLAGVSRTLAGRSGENHEEITD